MALTDYGERSQRFNDTTGTHGFSERGRRFGGNMHPDRCVCQGNPRERNDNGFGWKVWGDTIPHKHYSQPPYSCARCNECNAYLPWDEAAKVAAEADRERLREDARRIVREAAGIAA